MFAYISEILPCEKKHLMAPIICYLVSFVHEVLDIPEGGDHEFRQIFDIRAERRVLADFEVALVLWVEQIADTFAVDFHVRDLDTIAEGGVGVGFYPAKEFVAGQGYNATFFPVSHLPYETCHRFLWGSKSR